MHKPYIGITDFTLIEETKMMCNFFVRNLPKNLQRVLMVGVMMSQKTLNELPTKWGSIFPPKKRIQRIFFPHELLFNTLHYVDYEDANFAKNIFKALNFCGSNIDALQFDMIWPDVKVIKKIKEKNPEIQIIIQGNSVAMAQTDNNPTKFLEHLKLYGNSISYVLLDKSMGRGLGMDAKALLPFVRALKNGWPELGIAIAGGLGPNTIHLAEPVIREFPDVSIDAQSKLRPSGNALDPIDWDMARRYILQALKMFIKHR